MRRCLKTSKRLSRAASRARLGRTSAGLKPHALFPGTHFFGFGVLALPPGNLAAVAGPIYEELLLQQEQQAIAERGPGDIAKLLRSGDTWKID